MTETLNEWVGGSVVAGRFPFVYGDDCSMLLGIVTGLRDHVGDTGLVFIDGHEDTMPLDASEDREAANAEIGLLLGQRDEAWRQQFNVGSLGDCGVWLAPFDEVARDPADAGRRATNHLARHVQRWIQLTELGTAALSAGGCIGFSIAIYDPDQDAEGAHAARVVEFVGDVIRRAIPRD